MRLQRGNGHVRVRPAEHATRGRLSRWLLGGCEPARRRHDRGGGAAMTPAARSEGPTVVTADDHPATRLGVRMALTRGGFSVVAEAGDCEEAVRATVRTRPDLCLLDIRMPKGGGIEAARQIAEA